MIFEEIEINGVTYVRKEEVVEKEKFYYILPNGTLAEGTGALNRSDLTLLFKECDKISVYKENEDTPLIVIGIKGEKQ